jgi:hypothetical protein
MTTDRDEAQELAEVFVDSTGEELSAWARVATILREQMRGRSGPAGEFFSLEQIMALYHRELQDTATQ